MSEARGEGAGAEGAEGADLEDAPEPVLDEPAQAIAARLAALPDVPAPAGWQASVLAALPEDPPPRPAGARDEAPRGVTDAASVQATSLPRPDEDTRSASREAKDQAGSRQRGSRVRRWAMGGAAAAAAMAAALVVWRSRPEPIELGRPELLVQPSGGVRATPGLRRAALGDVLRVEVAAPADAVLRLYRNDRELVVECPSAAPLCRDRAGGLAAELTLAAPGSYRAVVLRPASKAPRATGDLGADLAACSCEVTTSQPVVAQ